MIEMVICPIVCVWRGVNLVGWVCAVLTRSGSVAYAEDICVVARSHVERRPP